MGRQESEQRTATGLPKATHEFQVIKGDGTLGEKVTKTLSPENTRRLTLMFLRHGAISDEQIRSMMKLEHRYYEEEDDGK